MTLAGILRFYLCLARTIPKGVEVTNRAKLLGHSVEVNLKNYSFADYDYCETALQALESNLVTPGDTQNVIDFETKKTPQVLVNTGPQEQ